MNLSYGGALFAGLFYMTQCSESSFISPFYRQRGEFGRLAILLELGGHQIILGYGALGSVLFFSAPCH